MRQATGVTLLTLVACVPLLASDVWVVGGMAESRIGACDTTRWIADPLFYNTTTSPAVVHIVHVSNGGADNVDAVLQPGTVQEGLALGAEGDSVLWISHLDLPNGVGVEGRMLYFGLDECSLFPPDPFPLGRVAMPVFTQLAPAGQEQLHFGTDLGHQHVRLNVGIYNAGSVPAQATTAIHLPECLDANTTSRTFVIPADTAVQVSLGAVTCASGIAYPSYVSVVVDQPSISFVSTLSNDNAPGVSVAVSPP